MLARLLFDGMRADGTRQSGLTLADPSGWRIGKRSILGGRTTHAMKLSAVNACIEVVTDSMAKMPIYLMDAETKDRQDGHPVLTVLGSRPNEAMAPFVYHKLVEARRLTEGNSYVIIMRDRWGQVTELIPTAPGYMQPYFDEGGRLWYVGTNPKTGERRKFWSTDILHYKAFSTDGIEGISVLTRAAQTIETALAAQGYEENFYSNGAQLSGVLQTDTDLSQGGKQNGKGIKDSIRGEWERMHAGADNAFRIAVLDHGLKYIPISASNKDAQFIESKAVSVEDISRFFGVPSYKLNTGKQSYSSNEQNAIEYIVKTLHPIVVQYEQEDTHKLLLAGDHQNHLQLRRNMMGELRGDWNTRGNWYKIMRQIGAFSVNDILALEDMPDVLGGETRLAPLDHIPLERFDDLSISRNTRKEET